MAIKNQKQQLLNCDPDEKLTRILKGCLQNDRRDQKELYQMYYGYGLSICIRYCNDRDEAVETLNTAFLKVFLNLNAFDLSRPFRPWLRQILVNESINAYKRNLRYDREVSLEADHSGPDVDGAISEISYREMIGMIQQLTPAYRAVFNLYVIEGYKHEEIAQMLNISVGTSKSNLAKAKSKMKRLLSAYDQWEHARR